jgi:hypothetical protein
MTKAKKKKQKRPQPSVAKSEAGPVAASNTRGIWRDLLRGTLFIVLLLGFKVAIEHTEIGKEIEHRGYLFLQRQLVAQPESIQIVDISDLPASQIEIDGHTYVATSRAALSQLIQAIADQSPKAIGVDIDFSPDDQGYITPKDPEFFQFCLELGVPVFLGILRTQALPPELWLKEKSYQPLAANIIIPNASTVRMPAALQTSPNFDSGPTISAALAGAFEAAHCRTGEQFRRAGLADQFSVKELGEGGSVTEFLVDYGPLDHLIEKRLRTSDPNEIKKNGKLFENKIVLIGDGTLGASEDTSVVPGKSQPISGVYVHASAAYTLTKMPLYELNWKGRLVIDVVLVAIVLLLVALVKFIFRKEREKRIATERIQLIFIGMVVAAAFGVGVLFVHETCVMWNDFILALGALVLHPSIERRLEMFWHFGKRTGPDVVRKVVFEQDMEKRK